MAPAVAPGVAPGWPRPWRRKTSRRSPAVSPASAPCPRRGQRFRRAARRLIRPRALALGCPSARLPICCHVSPVAWTPAVALCHFCPAARRRAWGAFVASVQANHVGQFRRGPRGLVVRAETSRAWQASRQAGHGAHRTCALRCMLRASWRVQAAGRGSRVDAPRGARQAGRGPRGAGSWCWPVV